MFNPAPTCAFWKQPALRRVMVGVPGLLAAIVLTGCGAMNSPLIPVPHQPSGSSGSPVVLLATSTANDRLVQFQVQITGVTLTAKSGRTVSLLSNTVSPEMIHLNSVVAPLSSVALPRDTYTAVTISVGSAQFVCTTYDSTRGLQTSTFIYGQVPSSSVHVTLESPISVAQSPVAVLLNVNVAQSVSLSSCQGGSATTFSITPTMTLAPLVLASPPTNSANGLLTGMHGLVSQVQPDLGMFTVAGADGSNLSGPTWRLATDTGTVFQGVSSTAQIAPGMPIDLDAAIQPDGSLLATRVSIYDTDTTDLNVFAGPLNAISLSSQSLSVIGAEQQGYLDSSSYYSGAEPISDQNATYAIAGAPDRLVGLPFNPVFSTVTAVPGQNVSVTSHVPIFTGGDLPAATITLMPQTVDGTIQAIGSAGSFTVYTVVLARYDLFPNLAMEPNQRGRLLQPGTVIVYAGPETQTLNTEPIAVGSMVRSYGQIFDDQGTLRMLSLQMSAGVAE